MCFSYINNIQWLIGSEDICFVRTAEANSLVCVSNQTAVRELLWLTMLFYYREITWRLSICQLMHLYLFVSERKTKLCKLIQCSIMFSNESTYPPLHSPYQWPWNTSSLITDYCLRYDTNDVGNPWSSTRRSIVQWRAIAFA